MTSKGYTDPIFRRLAGRLLPVQASLFQSFILQLAETIQNYICQSLLHKACRMVISSCQVYKVRQDNIAFPIG